MRIRFLISFEFFGIFKLNKCRYSKLKFGIKPFRHLDAYLDELEWRFNNRDNPYMFRDMLIKLIGSENLEYKKLIS